jgi:glycosyltransferase involved in cell wall biosynthesis
MRIAYVTTYDPANVRNWSGTGIYIAGMLKEQGFEVDYLGPLPAYSGPRHFWLRAKGVLYNRILREKFGRFSTERDHGISQFYADAVQDKLAERSYDLVVSPGSIPVAFLKTDVPIVLWADATFHGLASTYPEYSNRTPDYYNDGEALERSALSRATLCLFSSEWAAESALSHYKLDAHKVKVVPFGANLESDPDGELLRAAILARSTNELRLLLLGVDFSRKGGPKALKVVEELVHLGVPVHLDIVGCTPDVPEKLKPHVTVHGFVSKATDEGRQRIIDILQSSHWLMLLSSADCSPIVCCEANAFGVPCVSHRVGGIPNLIKEGLNGKLFSPDAPASDIAKYLETTFRDVDQYREMALRSRNEYETRLNWRSAGSRFSAVVRELCPMTSGVATRESLGLT